MLVTALYDQAVVLDHLIGVLLGKGGIHVWILFRHCNVVGQALVFVQQIFDDRILCAGLDDPIDAHILLQGVDHRLGIAGNGIELRGTDIVSGQMGGKGGHKDIDDYQDGQHYGGDSQRVRAAFRCLTVSLAVSGG